MIKNKLKRLREFFSKKKKLEGKEIAEEISQELLEKEIEENKLLECEKNKEDEEIKKEDKESVLG